MYHFSAMREVTRRNELGDEGSVLLTLENLALEDVDQRVLAAARIEAAALGDVRDLLARRGLGVSPKQAS